MVSISNGKNHEIEIFHHLPGDSIRDHFTYFIPSPRSPTTSKFGWSRELTIPKKVHQQQNHQVGQLVTLPETNIAHEKHIFSWWIPLKWWIFYGYVSLQGSNLPAPRRKSPYNAWPSETNRNPGDPRWFLPPPQKKRSLRSLEMGWNHNPRKLTSIPKMMVWTMHLLSNMAILGIYVRFQRGNNPL